MPSGANWPTADPELASKRTGQVLRPVEQTQGGQGLAPVHTGGPVIPRGFPPVVHSLPVSGLSGGLPSRKTWSDVWEGSHRN